MNGRVAMPFMEQNSKCGSVFQLKNTATHVVTFPASLSGFATCLSVPLLHFRNPRQGAQTAFSHPLCLS